MEKKYSSQSNNIRNKINITISPDFYNKRHKYVLSIIPPSLWIFPLEYLALMAYNYNKSITIRGYYNKIKNNGCI